MIKIICTTQKEKTALIEASQYLNSIKGIDATNKVATFFTNLYKNPGDIEIMNDGLNVNAAKQHRSFPKRYDRNKLYDL